jgi:hypothetical protein
MRSLLALLAPLALLVGCAANVISSTPTNVIVEHPGNNPGFAKALSAAQNECQKYNRSAIMDRQTCRGSCTTQFRCE